MRKWTSLKIQINYGFFGNHATMSIHCDDGGELIFKRKANRFIGEAESDIRDTEHCITKKSLLKLDKAVEEIRNIKELKGEMVMDGPSFSCWIYLSNGTIAGFHYTSMILEEEFERIEKELRQILREEFFLKKYRRY